ncbi:extracellular solute-binding protein [Spirochaeta isovalerica]|uniref:Raffinose/stachyose/melibiose transport system substrate-binding protein n=1 Tax=Spirochaeta isovalerica TaxID=150 RepID=A0A841R7S6_9SPIO|nr:extracellular solute-binding protein [Spirochaeta isovalerica]MBB6479915.1 raffinose/stachyose/melibiose transport system substrate-binding protein [Spirochaeta isovalerica]
MKKVFRLMLSSLLLFTMVTALSANGQQESAKPDSGPVVIEWWALSGGGGAQDPASEFKKQAVADYEASHPGVKINLTILENEAFKQKIQVAIQAGDPPDIFHSWGGGVMVEYARQGMLRDVTDYVNSTLSKKIGLGALGVYGYEGTYYGSPYDMGGVVFWYNKDIFDEVGVSVPKTWTELIETSKKIKAAGYVPIAMGAGDRWPAHFWWVYLAMRIGGIDAFNAAYGGNGSFKDETFVKAGELLLDLAETEPFQTGFLGASYDDQARLMGDGKAAMELMGQWAPSVEANNSASGEGVANLGMFTFPAVKGGKGDLKDVMGGGNGYIFGKDAPDEALDFLNFYLSVDRQKELVDIEGAIPVVKGADAALSGNTAELAKAVSQAGYYQLYYDQFLPPAVGEVVKDAVAALLAGEATPEEAAAMVDDSWQMEK